MLKLNQRVPSEEVPYMGTDGRLVSGGRTQTSARRSLKDGAPASAAIGDHGGRTTAGGVVYGPYSGSRLVSGQFESPAGQWCQHAQHWHRTTSAHPPPDVARRQTQRSNHSAAGDRNYFYDVAGNDSGDFTTFVEWDATGNDVMTVDRCHDDQSCATVASEHVYEMAA